MPPLLRPPARFATSTVLSALVLAGSLVWVPARAQTAANATPYLLEPPSMYSIGCFGPCDCAVRSTPLAGEFLLRFVSVDPLFTSYAVEKFRATFQTDNGIIELRGAGEYRIGGEFALTHQLKLVLMDSNGGTEAFDSGLIPGGGSFPGIRISAAAHGFACYDTVIDVVAKPLTAGVPGPDAARPALSAAPNPFRGGTTIECTLPHSAPISLTIVDLQGREVASLARGLALGAGPHALRWDGRNAVGEPVRAGVYLAILRLPGATARLRLVRLE
jgi:hypothetical protein